MFYIGPTKFSAVDCCKCLNDLYKQNIKKILKYYKILLTKLFQKECNVCTIQSPPVTMGHVELASKLALEMF